MVENNNSELTQELRKAIRLYGMNIPSKVQDTIIPVVEINPSLLRTVSVIRSSTKSTTGTGTIYTTPSNQDFYLTSATLTLIADAACDNTSVVLKTIVDGASSGRDVLIIGKPTLTATQITQTIALKYPIKVDRNTAITYGGTFTVGAMTVSVSIHGYIDGVSNA